MQEILEEKFETTVIDDERCIEWEDEEGRTRRSLISFVTRVFSEFEKSSMIEESPEGWKKTIERWDELGKFG